jgi:methyltransferase family protein
VRRTTPQALLAKASVKVASRLLRLVPQDQRPYFRTVGRAMLELPVLARGFLFGQDFAPRKSELRTSNPLAAYFDSHTQGPGIWKWRHYFDVYHRHLSKFVGREVHLLEVGVYSGGSLEMWKSYFGPTCRVYGVDIQEACKSYESESVRIFVGDQADRAFWKRVRDEVPDLDVVIDDGGHMTEQQIVTLEELLPHLRPGGVYICEDVYEVFNPFHEYVAGLTHQLNAWKMKPGVSHPHEGILPNAFQRVVSSVHLYPFIVVLEKGEASVSEFVAPKHGTHWQPWL